jgi:hypothetical protein
LVPFVSDTATSTASRPAFVTIASAPLSGRDGEGDRLILGQAASDISEIQKFRAPLARDGFDLNRRHAKPRPESLTEKATSTLNASSNRLKMIHFSSWPGKSAKRVFTRT